ncbi:MAG: pseudouridine-5'-phosphate glycosidase [Rubrivivax sp.]|nr:pseudouridine-5'-phosphate glycosidase [Rubrivivax sp.]
MNALLDIHPEVADALHHGRSVVALESTIISHGMPWPQNLETALRVEAAVREHGAVPATVAVMAGRLKAGLTHDDIESLARQGLTAPKVSRRDLPLLLAEAGTGATTVAATMIVAALAGIRIFATGGIGGVHRGAATSFDISADLQELARTSVAVVCAGAKAILDLKLTLEYLETQGVPVIGFGTDELPAFYSRASGLKVNRRLDTPEQIARVLHAKWQAGLQGGVVIANPIAPEHEIPRERIDGYIGQALREVQQQGVEGAAVTPFLLARVSELTGGASLAANIELVLANARLAARVAGALAALSADEARAARQAEAVEAAMQAQAALGA